MFSLMKRSWFLTMLATLIPSLAFAGSSIHASGYLGLFVLIVVIAILAGVALWAIGYWAGELNRVTQGR